MLMFQCLEDQLVDVEDVGKLTRKENTDLPLGLPEFQYTHDLDSIFDIDDS